jgi:hypothetical protein
MESKQMYDRTLVKLNVDWSAGCVELELCPLLGERGDLMREIDLVGCVAKVRRRATVIGSSRTPGNAIFR